MILQFANRHANNQNNVGFANPWIYKMAKSGSYETYFNDVVEGNNDLFDVKCCNAGDNFDLATGWGSPQFDTW